MLYVTFTFNYQSCNACEGIQHKMYILTRSPATAGKANCSLLFLEHRIPMPELFTELRFSVLLEFWTQEIRLPLLGGDAPRLG